MPVDPGPGGLTALRAANRGRLIDELQRHRRISRAELARTTGLSPTTVSSIVNELSAQGLVADTAEVRHGTGRPARLLRYTAAGDLVAGIDFGHQVIRVAISGLSGQPHAYDESDVDVDAAGADALEQAASMLLAAGERAGTDPGRVIQLVVGVPGFVDPSTGTVVSDRMPAWRGMRPAAVLTERTGWPATIENDADLAALGEQRFGAANGLADVIYVKVSAGIGAGLVLGGRLYRASRGGAGELGHIQLREDGELCSCGNRGCLETIASVTVALAALRAVRPELTTADEVAALVAAGDRAAVRVVSDMGRSIGRAIADLCNALAPQAVVIGGDLAGPPAPMMDAITNAVARYTQPRIGSTVQILPTALGGRAGLLGTVAAASAERSSERP